MDGAQRPLELILARNLLSSLSTPATLVDEEGTIVFFNEAAGEMLGRRFEETGPMSPQTWGEAHGPFDEQGNRVPWDELDLTHGLMRGRAGHSRFCIRAMDGLERTIEASSVPIVTTSGQRGAMSFFWETE